MTWALLPQWMQYVEQWSIPDPSAGASHSSCSTRILIAFYKICPVLFGQQCQQRTGQFVQLFFGQFVFNFLRHFTQSHKVYCGSRLINFIRKFTRGHGPAEQLTINCCKIARLLFFRISNTNSTNYNHEMSAEALYLIFLFKEGWDVEEGKSRALKKWGHGLIDKVL